MKSVPQGIELDKKTLVRLPLGIWISFAIAVAGGAASYSDLKSESRENHREVQELSKVVTSDHDLLIGVAYTVHAPIPPQKP